MIVALRHPRRVRTLLRKVNVVVFCSDSGVYKGGAFVVLLECILARISPFVFSNAFGCLTDLLIHLSFLNKLIDFVSAYIMSDCCT